MAPDPWNRSGLARDQCQVLDTRRPWRDGPKAVTTGRLLLFATPPITTVVGAGRTHGDHLAIQIGRKGLVNRRQTV